MRVLQPLLEWESQQLLLLAEKLEKTSGPLLVKKLVESPARK